MTERQQRALYEQIGFLVTQSVMLRAENEELRAKLEAHEGLAPVGDGQRSGER
jgi:regulator of replication initiation timing